MTDKTQQSLFVLVAVALWFGTAIGVGALKANAKINPVHYVYNDSCERVDVPEPDYNSIRGE